jgi:hypothetical protein
MMTRGQHAGDQARTSAAFDTQASQIQFENAAADQLAKYKNDLSVYGVREANRRAGFEADQTNRANIGQFLERARIAQQPSYETSAQGIIEQLPGQRPRIIEEFSNRGGGDSEAWKYYHAARKGDYGPQAKFEVLFEEAQQAGDETTGKQLVMQNIIDNNQGAQAWGPEEWAEIEQIASERVQARTGGAVMSDPKLMIQQLSQEAAALAWERYQETGSEHWLQNAARMGNKGARVFVGE